MKQYRQHEKETTTRPNEMRVIIVTVTRGEPVIKNDKTFMGKINESEQNQQSIIRIEIN